MSVEQYSAEFQKLSRYAPHLIPDEQTKAKGFHDGLLPRILEWVIVLNVTNYTEMVHVATMAEKGIREAAPDYMNRKWMKSAGSLPPLPPSKRHSASGSGSEKMDTPASHVSVGVPRCTKCGKAHPGECRFGTGLCFRCGKPGHFTR